MRMVTIFGGLNVAPVIAEGQASLPSKRPRQLGTDALTAQVTRMEPKGVRAVFWCRCIGCNGTGRQPAPICLASEARIAQVTPMDEIDVYLEISREHPYNSRPAKDWAEYAALGVLANLMDRRGIKHTLRLIEGDEDVTEEIVMSLAETIRRAHSAEATPE